MAPLLQIALLAVYIVSASCKRLPLPSYITPCQVSDPILNECAAKNGQIALQSLLKGDPNYKVPVFKPLRTDKMTIDHGGNGSIAVKWVTTNMRLYGMEANRIDGVKIDLQSRSMTINMSAPGYQLLGDYTMTGKFLVLPINGQGFFNLTSENIELTFTLRYDLIKKSDNLEYMVFTGNDLFFRARMFHILFENIINRNKELSDNLNMQLNQHWRVVVDELGPPISAFFGPRFQNLVSNLLSQTPYNEIFVD